MRSDAKNDSRRRGLRRIGRGRLALAIALSLGASLLLAPDAFANFFTPKSGGSPNANAIDSLYKIVLYIAAVVFAVVEGALVYSVYKFRAKKGAVAAQIHGNTSLEIGWTVGAAVILVILTTVTFIKLPSIINPPNSSANGLPLKGGVLTASTTEPQPPNGKKLIICVIGRQFIWAYYYGSGCETDPYTSKVPYSYQEMYVPANTVVVLHIQSLDVIHSWWIPSLGGKVDAVPGYTTYTWFEASKTGALYHGQCAELCGRLHAAMTALVQVLTPAHYQSWLAHQTALIAGQDQQVLTLRKELVAAGQLTPNLP
ncbi:MAG: cytochrome c oxidase subunit II [Actinomycetota bacterium]|nr:cytochrome c oxidase subunit II [Actinomycetota bacterium]